MRTRMIAASALLLAFASPGHTQGTAGAEPVIAPVTTRHQVVIAGRPVPYRATFAERVLRDAAGVAQATISATSYVREDAPDGRRRPVMFVFNGGPGASSSPLHFSAFGPALTVKAADGSRTIAPNPDSLLGQTDLVFVDPVGTGFSRVLPGGSGRPYWSVPGDAAAVLDLIRGWLRDNHRERSPVVIAGESYGGARAARICADAGDLNVVGLVLVSPSLTAFRDGEARSRDRRFVFELPSMAVAAARNGRASPGKPIAAVFDEARAFAVGDYAAALAQGGALSADRRREVAGREAALIGVPVDTVLAANLRLDIEDYRKALRRSEGLVVGRLDTRVTAPIPTSDNGRPSAANDPALGLGATNVITSDVIGRYMHDELKVPTARDYVSLTLDVNFQWDWAASDRDPKSQDLAADIAGLMRAKPAMRVLLVGGYYDMTVPLLAPRQALADGGVPMDRVTAVALEEGHSTFDSPTARTGMAALFRPLLTSRS